MRRRAGLPLGGEVDLTGLIMQGAWASGQRCQAWAPDHYVKSGNGKALGAVS
jgi:hypothetical protein